MPVSRVKTWSSGDVLTASDLNAEFNNILDNAVQLVQPWSGNFDLDGNTLILDGDADTSIDAATDDQIDIAIAGADDFRLTANTFTALSGSSIVVESGAITVTDGQTILADPDSRTNTVATPVIVRSETSGTPAADIGTGVLLQAESADESPSDVGMVCARFSDVSAGSEDSYFSFLLRIAGSALIDVWRLASTTAFKGIFTHANTADRTYTFPDVNLTVLGRSETATVTGKTISCDNNTLTVNTSALRTATGSSSATGASAWDVAMNDYSFAPNLFGWDSSGYSVHTTALSCHPGTAANTPNDQVARIRFGVTSASTTYYAKWRYVTASDEPTIWIVPNEFGEAIGVWVSDDPLTATDTVFEEDPETGLIVMRTVKRVLQEPPIQTPGSGYTPVQVPLAMLANVAMPQRIIDSAQRHIDTEGLKQKNLLYRALQIHTRDESPSGWVMKECVWKGGEFRPMTGRERAEKQTRTTIPVVRP